MLELCRGRECVRPGSILHGTRKAPRGSVFLISQLFWGEEDNSLGVDDIEDGANSPP